MRRMQREKVPAVFAAVCFATLVFVCWHSSEPAQGQPQSNARHGERQALAVDQIDTRSSRVYVYVGKTGFGHEHAVLGAIKKGVIHLGASHDAGQIVFDMSRFVAGTAEARRYIGLKGTASASTARQVTANMLSKDVLDVRRFPTSTFTISSALPLKSNGDRRTSRYVLDGAFTLHGVTRPLKLVVEAKENDEKVHLRGHFSIRQTSFGITPYSKAFGAVGVADKLTIYGEIDVAKAAKISRKGGKHPASIQ